MDDKLGLKRIKHEDTFNELDIEKRELFLEKLQEFLVEVGLAKLDGDPYLFEGKRYGRKTYYALFLEDREGEHHKIPLEKFGIGETLRYRNKNIELLIIFLQDKIKVLFYASPKYREIMLNALSKFVVLE